MILGSKTVILTATLALIWSFARFAASFDIKNFIKKKKGGKK
jgi:hypothetical protein